MMANDAMVVLAAAEGIDWELLLSVAIAAITGWWTIFT